MIEPAFESCRGTKPERWHCKPSSASPTRPQRSHRSLLSGSVRPLRRRQMRTVVPSSKSLTVLSAPTSGQSSMPSRKSLTHGRSKKRFNSVSARSLILPRYLRKGISMAYLPSLATFRLDFPLRAQSSPERLSRRSTHPRSHSLLAPPALVSPLCCGRLRTHVEICSGTACMI